MAFPVVESAVNSLSGGFTDTTLTVTLPTSIASGDLILIAFACDGTPTVTAPSGYTQLLASAFNSRRIVWYKWSSGSEPSSVDVTVDVGEAMAAVAMRISGADSNTDPEGNGDIEGTNVPNPLSLSPSWGSDDNLWVIGTGGDGRCTVTTWPTNYSTNTAGTYYDHSNGTHLWVAWRTAAAATEDPGAFTLNLSDQTGYFTIGVRPTQPPPTRTATANALPVGGTSSSASAKFQFTGSATPTTGGATTSVSATHTAPTFSATADSLAAGTTSSTTAATFEVPVYDGTATPANSGATLTAAAQAGYGAVTLPNTSSYGTVADFLGAESALTVSAWVLRSLDTGPHTIVGQYDYEITTQISWVIMGDSGGKLSVKLSSDSGGTNAKFYQSGSSTFPANAWTHVAFTFDAGTLKLFINGSEVATPTKVVDGTCNSLYNATIDVEIGRHAYDNYLRGSLADVRIYTSALSATDVNNVKNNTAIDAIPVAHWPGDDKTGSTLTDKVGSNNITLTNANWNTPQTVYLYQNACSAAVTAGGTSGSASATFTEASTTFTATADALPVGGIICGGASVWHYAVASTGTDASLYLDGRSTVRAAITAPTLPFSVSYWCRRNPLNLDWRTAVSLTSNTSASTYFRLLFRLNSNNIRIERYTQASGDDFVEVTKPLTSTDGSWNHFVVVYNSSTHVTLYGNGSQVYDNNAMVACDPASECDMLLLGASRYISPSQYWFGDVADVRVYASALNSTEAAAVHANGIVGKTPVIHWPLYEGSGAVANDIAGVEDSDGWDGGRWSAQSVYSMTFAASAALTTGGAASSSSVTFSTGAGTYTATADSLSIGGTASASVASWGRPCITLTGTNYGASATDFLSGGTALSVAFWLRYSESGAQRNFVGQYEITGNQRGWLICTDSPGSHARFVFSSDGTYAAETVKDWRTNATINDGAWHHIAFTWNSGALTLYLDGVDVNASAVKTYDASFSSIYNSTDVVRLANLGSGTFAGDAVDLRIWESALAASDITTVYNGGRVGSPVAHWHLTDGTSATADDDVGGHDLTLSGGSHWQKLQRFYMLQRCLTLSATGYGTATDFLSGGSQFSAAAWAYRDTANSTDTIIGHWHYTTAQRSWLMIGNSSGQFEVLLSPDGTTTAYKRYTTGGSTWPAGTWKHLGFTFNNNVLELYIDGVKQTVTKTVDGTVNSLHNSTANIELGRYTGIDYLQGRLADIRLWTTELSESQMAAVYNNTAVGATPVAWWRLDEVGGTTAVDSIGGNNIALAGDSEATYFYRSQLVYESAEVAAAALAVGGTTSSSSGTFTGGAGTYTGSAALTTGGTESTGAASFAPGTKTAAAAAATGATTSSTSATFTAPVYDGSAAVATGGATSAASATFTAANIFTATANNLPAAGMSIRANGAHGTLPCVTFDGSNDYAEVAHYAEWNLNADFTVFLRFRLDDTWGGHWNGLFDKNSGNPWATNTGFSIHTHGNNGASDWLSNRALVAKIGDGTSSVAHVTATGLADGQWHSIAAVVNHAGDTLAVYVDGVIDGSPEDITAVGTITSTSAVQIANGYTKPSGSMGDVRLYQSALSGANIATLHSGGIIGTQPLNWWDCTQGTGTTLTDKVGGKNMSIFGGTAAEYWSATQDAFDPQCIGSTALTTGTTSASASATFSTAAPFTATANGLPVGGASSSSSASFAPGTKTATAAVNAGATTSSTASTFTAPVYDGSAAVAVGGTTGAAAATYTNTNTFQANAPLTLGATSLSSAAAHTTPVYTASSPVTAGGVAGAAAATNSIPTSTAASTLTTGGTVGVAAGTVADPVYSCSTAVALSGAAGASAAAFIEQASFAATMSATTGGASSAVLASTGRSCLTLDGVNDYGLAGAFIQGGPALSAAMWVKPQTLTVDGEYILSQWDYGLNQRSWALIAFNGGVLFGVSADGTSAGSKQYWYQTPLTLDQWTHLCMTFSANSLKLYVNGSEVAAVKNADPVVNSLHASTAQVAIGTGLNNKLANHALDFKGSLLDGRVWTAQLSAAEVAKIYANEAIDKHPVAHWPANEKTGTTMDDKVGIHDALLYGGTSGTYWGQTQTFYWYQQQAYLTLTAGAASSTSSASHVTPDFSATANLAAGSTACASPATHAPPVFAASAGVSTGGATLASSASFTYPHRSSTSAVAHSGAIVAAAATHAGPTVSATAAGTTGGAASTSQAWTNGGYAKIASAITSSTGPANSTSLTVTLPPNINAGDLILIFFVTDGTNTVTGPSGYTQLLQNSWECRRIVWYKYSDGIEPASVTVVNSAAQMMVAAALRITGSDVTTIPEAVNDIENTANPDPLPLTPTWGSGQTLWIAGTGGDNRPTVSAWPTGYTSNQTSVYIDDIQGAHLYLASKEANAASDDPSAFTLNFSDQSGHFTIGVRPYRVIPAAYATSHVLVGGAECSATVVTSHDATLAATSGAAQFAASASTVPQTSTASAPLALSGVIGQVTSATVAFFADAPIALNAGYSFAATLTYSDANRYAATDILVGGATVSASGTVVNPAWTASAALTTAATEPWAYTFTFPPIYDATAPLVLPWVSVSATASTVEATFTSSIAVSAGAAVVASIATAADPVSSGSAAIAVGSTGFASTAIGLDPEWGAFATLAVPAAELSAAAAFEPGATASAGLVHSGATVVSYATAILLIEIDSVLALPATETVSNATTLAPVEVTATADNLTISVEFVAYTRRKTVYVPWIVNKVAYGEASKQTYTVVATSRAGRSERPFVPDWGETTIPNEIGGQSVLVTPAASCLAVASTARSESFGTASPIAGGCTTTALAAFIPPGRSGASAGQTAAFWGLGSGVFAGPTRTGSAAVTVASAGSTSAAFTAQPVYSCTVSASLGGVSHAAAASRVLPVISIAGVLSFKRRSVSVGQTVKPKYTATASMLHSGALSSSTGSNKEATFIAAVPIATKAGKSLAASLTYHQPSRAATAAVLHSGAFGRANASRVTPQRTATSVVASLGLTGSGNGVMTPPVSRTATAAVTHSGNWVVASAAKYTPKFRTATSAVAHSGAFGAGQGSFTPASPVGTTPLWQPWWLDELEDYPYTKPGVAYNSTTYETIFTEGNAIVVRNDTELAAALTSARNNSAIDAIYLDPVYNTPGYTFPNHAFRYFPGRPINRPLVIRTLPGSAQQAFVLRVYEDYPVKQVAFVDFKVEAFQIRGGGQDILIEKVVFYEGAPVIQSAVNQQPITGAMTNVHIRLCVSKYFPGGSSLYHALYTYNIVGLLAEGNIMDHGGWGQSQTRATPPPPTDTGPSTRKHNWYCNDYSRDTYIRFNWIARASSHGLHLKGGGVAYQNMLIRNPINAEEGYGKDGQYAAYGLSDGHFHDNMILDSDHINTWSGDVRGNGLWITCVDGLLVEDNYFLEWTGNSNVNAGVIVLDEEFPIINTIIRNNKAANWANGVIKRGQGVYPHQASLQNNNWACSFGGSAKTLADILKSDSNLDNYNVTRERLGVDIVQLKTWMNTIKAGVLG